MYFIVNQLIECPDFLKFVNKFHLFLTKLAFSFINDKILLIYLLYLSINKKSKIPCFTSIRVLPIDSGYLNV
jgi:hypothetical protein